MATKKQWKEYLKELRQYKRKQLNNEIELIEDLLDDHAEDGNEEQFGPGSNPPPPPPPPRP